ncbi:MAG TPA: hypothetical protein VMZ22_07275 [Acidimicrobiales bacterium]|nr:hypothetical protein [Acidimicrobiales bacterium]
MVAAAAAWALRTGIRKGVAGGSGPWLVVAVAAGFYKLATRPGKGSALRLDVKPGERYSIACSDQSVKG